MEVAAAVESLGRRHYQGLHWEEDHIWVHWGPRRELSGHICNLADWEQEHFDNIVKTIPLQRSGEPSDIAGAVYFFANSPYLTGQELFVDGGWGLNAS